VTRTLSPRRGAFAAAGALALLLTGPAPGAAEGDPSPGGNALGIGEPRAPETFTLELRFLDAARRGDRKTLERAIERGVSLETKDDLGRDALLLAARDAESLELVRFLREKGAGVDVPDIAGRAAISFAAESGRLDIVRELAAHGAQTDRADGERRTPLFFAVLGDKRETVVFLLERGADVNAANQFGDTPLMMACAKGYGELATLLLGKGADPARKDQEGRTARERAAEGTAACLALPPS
jgi:ankyrin repeat protein